MDRLKLKFPYGYIEFENNEAIGPSKEHLHLWLINEVGPNFEDILKIMFDLNLVWMSSFNIETITKSWFTTVDLYCWKKDVDIKRLTDNHKDYSNKVIEMFGY